MPEYLAPGVYVEEIERGPRPIEGVPTSTAAILGETERGPLRPRLVTSFGEYSRWFGSVFLSDRFLPHAASGFFDNGGKRLYVTRIAGAGATAASRVFGDFTATAVGPGLWGRRVWVRVMASRTLDNQGTAIGFRLRLAYWSAQPPSFFDPFDEPTRGPRPQYQEEFDDLTVDPLSSNYFSKRLTDAATNQPISALAGFKPTTTGAPPALPAVTGGDPLDVGGADAPAPLTAVDFRGDADTTVSRELQGLRMLELDPFRDVALVYAPAPSNDPNGVGKELVTHCENQRYRFAVIDSPNAEPIGLFPRNQQSGITDTTYAAFYAPWIVIADPLTGARVTVPPGGHMLGIYARSDTERGVFKAPANEIVKGALDVRFEVNDATQSELNPRGVNAIRAFPSRGIRIWGARTLSSNGLWKYVSVRRLFIFLERSIYEGTQWVVFEPNDDRLWARVKDTIRLFLRTQWREGALFGRTEDEAFFITCDRSTMTQDDILNGRLICEIGIAPVRPAEFVIFRVFQHTAESQR
jgi:phage tail sheath protein FI